MKKTLLAMAATLSFGYANAQMKLGNNPTTTNANALLELETTNKGLLLPRVALTSTTAFAPLTAHVAGMTVYNTATAGDVTPGNYFNDGTKWVRLLDANASFANLYTADGALTADRTATLGTNDITWASTGGAVIIESTTASPGSQLNIENYGANNSNGISLNKYHGTKAAPENVKNNWNLGTISFRGSEATGILKPGASIVGVAAEDFFSTASGTNLDFRTTSIGASSVSQKMRLTSAGNLGIGITSPSTKLHIAGALTTNIETVGSFNDILHVTGPSWGFGDKSRTLSWSYNLAGTPGGDGLHLFIPANVTPAAAYTDAIMNFYTDNGGANKVGINTINPATTLDVNGTTKTTNLQITTGSGAGKVLTSDASGNASWQTPTVVGGLGGAFNPIGTTSLLMATGAAEADVPGVTQTFTLTQAATVNVIATGIISNYSTGFSDIQGSFKINVDGTNATAAFASSGDRVGLGAMPTPITLSYNVVLAAGTHTIKLKYKPWHGGANINLDAFAIPYSGATAIDTDALKSRMSILIFNN